jgi:transcription-repair coupling factor (superfamily II helicase)
MMQLLQGRIQVLVCTTIIETGIDVPNANTIFIDDADHFGLSQIHQLRGRVGRSERQAVAYLLHRKGRELTAEAQDRLQAIREYTALGSGYQLALKDLEFRGAGNLLGADQSGKWQDVGLHLYLDILNESVASARGEKFQHPHSHIRLDSKITYAIPDTYIANARERLGVYYRLMACETPADAEDLMRELADRYGKLPAVVERLLQSVVYQLKTLTEAYGAARL